MLTKLAILLAFHFPVALSFYAYFDHESISYKYKQIMNCVVAWFYHPVINTVHYFNKKVSMNPTDVLNLIQAFLFAVGFYAVWDFAGKNIPRLINQTKEMLSIGQQQVNPVVYDLYSCRTDDEVLSDILLESKVLHLEAKIGFSETDLKVFTKDGQVTEYNDCQFGGALRQAATSQFHISTHNQIVQPEAVQ